MKYSRSIYAKAAVVALALVAAGTATVAQAGGNVFFSIGANVAPGVSVGVSNMAPAYYPPVYVQPAPVVVAPQPVYYGYVAPAVYVQPAPVYYAPGRVYYSPGHAHHGHWRDGRWR
jgi:hypothetical protein